MSPLAFTVTAGTGAMLSAVDSYFSRRKERREVKKHNQRIAEQQQHLLSREEQVGIQQRRAQEYAARMMSQAGGDENRQHQVASMYKHSADAAKEHTQALRDAGIQLEMSKRTAPEGSWKGLLSDMPKDLMTGVTFAMGSGQGFSDIFGKKQKPEDKENEEKNPAFSSWSRNLNFNRLFSQG